MTRISNTEKFPIDNKVTDKDIFIGSDADTQNKTKNFSAIGVKNYVLGFSDEDNPTDGLLDDNGTYTWVKYADDVNGTNMSDYPTDKLYVGFSYGNEEEEESTDPLDYVWALITESHVDGNGTYTWLKYATTPDASILYDSPDGMTWMGLAYNQEDPIESSNYEDYNWHRIAESDAGFDQNNLVRIIHVDAADLISEDDAGLADYVNRTGLIVYQDENIVFHIYNETQVDGDGGGDVIVPDIPILDSLKTLDLTVGTVDETSAVINWNPNADTAIVKYDLFYKNLTTQAVNIVNLIDEVTTTLTVLDSGTNYEVYVVAYDTLGNTKNSNTETFATSEVFVPSTPNLELADKTDTTIDLTWSVEASFNADRYELFTSLGGLLYSGTDTTFQVAGLIQNTAYGFYVIAFSGATASNQSATLNVTTLVTVLSPLSQPTLKILTVRENDVDFATAVGIDYAYELDRITGWKLEFRVKGNLTWQERDYTNISEVYNLAHLVSNVRYELRVSSFDGAVISLPSLIREVLTLGAVATAGAELNLSTNIPPVAEGYALISNAQPNTNVDIEVSIKTYSENGATQLSIGSILFDNQMVTVTPVRPKTVTIPIDSAGRSTNADSHFLIDILGDSIIGLEYHITVTIISSVNGVNLENYSDTVIYKHLQSYL